jgi:hypothetical protein
MRLLINISRTGNDQQNGELRDISKVDVAHAEGHRASPRLCRGIKVRVSDFVAGKNDLPGLRLAQSVAGPLGVPIMVHIGQSVSPSDLLAVLKRGDIVTHLYSPLRTEFLSSDGSLCRLSSTRSRRHLVRRRNGLNKHITWMSPRATKVGPVARHDLHRLGADGLFGSDPRFRHRPVEVSDARHAAYPRHCVRDGERRAGDAGVQTLGTLAVGAPAMSPSSNFERADLRVRRQRPHRAHGLAEARRVQS